MEFEGADVEKWNILWTNAVVASFVLLSPAPGVFPVVMVMFAVPLKETPLIVLAVASFVAEAALQAKFPVAALAHAVVAIFVLLSPAAGVGAQVYAALFESNPHPMLVSVVASCLRQYMPIVVTSDVL